MSTWYEFSRLGSHSNKLIVTLTKSVIQLSLTRTKKTVSHTHARQFRHQESTEKYSFYKLGHKLLRFLHHVDISIKTCLIFIGNQRFDFTQCTFLFLRISFFFFFFFFSGWCCHGVTTQVFYSENIRYKYHMQSWIWIWYVPEDILLFDHQLFDFIYE